MSSDDQWILLGSRDNNAYILDAQTGSLAYTLKAHKAIVFGASFSPAGPYMASGDKDGLVRIWKYDVPK